MLTSEMLPRELASSTQQNFCKAAFIEVSAMEASTYSSGSSGVQHLSIAIDALLTDDDNNNLSQVLTVVAQKVAQRVTTCHLCTCSIQAGDQIIGCLIDGEEMVWQCSDNCGKPLYFIDEGFGKEPEWVPCIHTSLYWIHEVCMSTLIVCKLPWNQM